MKNRFRKLSVVATISLLTIALSSISPSHATTLSASIYPREGPAGVQIDAFFNTTSQTYRVFWDDLFLLNCDTSRGGTLPCMQNNYSSDHLTFYAPTNRPYSDGGLHNVTVQTWVSNVGFVTNHFDFTIPVPSLQALLFWQGSASIVNSSVTFYASVFGGTSPYTYTWNFGDGMTGSGNPVAHTFQTKGNYTVIVTATDSNAQQISATQTISVISLPKPVAGPPGPQGSPGPAGPPGPQGPAGSQGTASLPTDTAALSYVAIGVSSLAIIASVVAVFFSRRRMGAQA